MAFVFLEGKGWLDLLPEGGIGEGVLKFAAVLAKHWQSAALCSTDNVIWRVKQSAPI